MNKVVTCKSWACATCGPHLKQTWYESLTRQLRGVEHLEIVDVPLSQLEAVKKRIDRLGGSRATLKTDDPNVRRILTNVPVGGRALPKRWKKRKLAIRELVAELPFTSRPITTSRDWAKRKKPRKTPPIWTVVGICAYSLRAVRTIKERLGMTRVPVDARTDMYYVPEAWYGEGKFRDLLAMLGIYTPWGVDPVPAIA